MKKLAIIILLGNIFYSLIAQQDPEAKKILDQFSEKTKSFSAIKAEFEFKYTNKQTKETTNKKGTLLIKGDKYALKFPDSEQFSDGTAIYTYLPKSKEVAITKAGSNKDDFFLNNPSKLFSLYNKDYKYKLVGETKLSNVDCYEIDLFPQDIKKPIFRIKLLIEKETMLLKSAKASEKSGVDYEVILNKQIPNSPASDKDFVFDTDSNKDVEVVDMR